MQERATADAKLKEFAETMQKLKTALEALPAGNEKAAQIQQDLDETKARSDAYYRRQSEAFDRRMSAFIREQYASVIEQLGLFCKQRGIKIVVQAAEKDLPPAEVRSLNMRIEMQTALYWDADQDITDAFVGFINQRWAEKNAAPAPAPVPAPAPAPATPPNGGK